ncbi:MAG: hypothetical protein LBE56_11740 [Tannerella sp.]|jgi:hypothetical protein|nr:hypothetical protein [Tannerella sp.]
MVRKFENIKVIETRELYDVISAYGDALIDEATENGSLADPDADNEYTREIGRVGIMCADYESIYMTFSHLKFKKPVINGVENDFSKESIRQLETAEIL